MSTPDEIASIAFEGYKVSSVCLLTTILLCWSGESGESRQTELQQAYPELYNCGPNAVYMFLKLVGRDVRYSDIFEHTGADGQGVTLLEVKNELQRFGLAAEIIQCQPSDLPLISTPYIIYTLPDLPGEFGHFDIVVATNDKTLEVIDTITGLEETYSLERIATNLRNGRYFQDGIMIVRLKERTILPEIACLIVAFTLFALIHKATRMKLRRTENGPSARVSREHGE